MEEIKLPKEIKKLLDECRALTEEEQNLKNEIVGKGSALYSVEKKSDEELLRTALVHEISAKENGIATWKGILKKYEELKNEESDETDTTPEGDNKQS